MTTERVYIPREYAETKVAQIEMLGGVFYTPRGWTLLEVFFADEPHPTWRDEIDPRATYSGASPIRLNTGTIAIRRAFALLGRNEADAIAEVQAYAQKLAETRDLLQQAVDAANKTIAHHEEEEKRLGGELARSVKKNDAVWADLNREQDRARKLEKDIAKIRAAIGELKMKEILEAK